MKRMTKKDFSYVSPASGNNWTFEYLCEKIAQRSKSARLNVHYVDCSYETPYGDKDLLVGFDIATSSSWTVSPEVACGGVLPLHLTCSGDLVLGFGCDDNVTPDTPVGIRINNFDNSRLFIVNTSFNEVAGTPLLVDILNRIKRSLLRSATREFLASFED